ncbi:hypothetical protein FQN57_002974 [Myotisia sp. PD_48]|nr:hypothetical protein FQN57_002974 [Myotisia sp. PD_48]
MPRPTSLIERLRSPSTYSLPSRNPIFPRTMDEQDFRRRVSTTDLMKVPTIDEIAPTAVHITTGNGFSKAFLELPRREGSRSTPPPQPSTSSTPSSPRDPLPEDNAELDGVLNYHLGQLDRIKREIVQYNTTLEQLNYTITDMVNHPAIQHAATQLHDRLQGVRNARNLLAKFVVFHLQEIDRISSVKISMGGRDVHDT